MKISNENTKQYLEIRAKKHKEKWDTVIVVCGYVGTGKSNFGLHLQENWNKINGIECTPEHVKNICMTQEDFFNRVAEVPKNTMVIYDEAGDLNSRRSMSSFNVNMMTAYRIIRADTLFTVLIIDDIFDLDTYFRNKRVKALFYVDQRGKVACWLRDRLKILLNLNANRQIKNYWLVTPNFYDVFDEYNGILRPAYDIMKENKTTEFRKSLKELTKEKPKTEDEIRKELQREQQEEDAKMYESVKNFRESEKRGQFEW